MRSKKTLDHYVEGELADGTLRKFAIFKKGGSWFIDDHLVLKGTSIRDELAIVFHARFIRKIPLFLL